MKQRSRVALFLVAAFVLGLAASEALYHWIAVRNLAGQLSGRGRVVGLTKGRAIYESDLSAYEASTQDLIAGENLRRAAASESVDPGRVDRELALLEAQFGSRKAFQNALHADGLSISVLRDKIATQLRGLTWLDKRVQPPGPVEQKLHQFYEAHRDSFTQPIRYRAAHVFLAAHAETPPEIVEEKERGIAALATRLDQGEPLSQVATEVSEDAATKPRGGDLGYFAEARTPPDFLAELKKLRPGQISRPFRTHLGFHIAQLIETRDAKLLEFEQCRAEIALALANQRRAAAIAGLAAEFARSD